MLRIINKFLFFACLLGKGAYHNATAILLKFNCLQTFLSP
ncbi:hypothetical protein HMP0721_0354 [Pseudoramibacter alactolyticus ATCC 23263]|uniref:Uncharacterized protein n=1 Tax=Pseudoramibacter alactolyticus ATCC 23263 TaxID=887929 RepID=E6MEC1_9FIRM|nr:hypothetical protein HMP0721_0354 [Pseudoramibacter alactolyticus ATCC 23263]